MQRLEASSQLDILFLVHHFDFASLRLPMHVHYLHLAYLVSDIGGVKLSCRQDERMHRQSQRCKVQNDGQEMNSPADC